MNSLRLSFSSDSDIQGSFLINFHVVRTVRRISSTIHWIEMRNPFPFDENIITDKSQHKKLSNQHFFPIQNQWKEVWFWMFNARDNQQLWNRRRVFWWGTFHFLTKNVTWWLFLKINFSNFERWIITCFIVAVFRYFTILCFLKTRHNPGWSVRTLDQYSLYRKLQYYIKWI